MNYKNMFQRLRDVREDNNLSQANVANMLNISRPNYTRWETREKIIPLRKLNEYCNIFKVSMDYVVGLEKNNYYTNYDKDIDIKIVSQRIKSVRIKNNLTQMNLANMLNCDQSIISDYENGRTLILTSLAIDICKKFNISLDWLCGRK